MSIGVQLPFIDYTQVGGDSGQNDAASVLPYNNGEELVEAVLRRPIEALRLRTERIRSALEDQLYRANADRLLLAGSGRLSWPGAAPGNSGILTLVGGIYLTPFLTPGASLNSPPVGSTFGTLMLQRQVGAALWPGLIVTSRRRNYEGGNRFNVTVVSGGATSVVIEGSPPRNVIITATAGSTLGTVSTLINGLLDEQGTPALAATLAPLAGLGDILASPAATRFIEGNWDAEGHVITSAALSSFFALPDNALQEGDTLAIWYAAMIEDPGHPSVLGALGGRRQSIPENSNTTVPPGSFFNSRMHPERLTNALPICKVINNQLCLIGGTVLDPGSTSVGVGQTNAADVYYHGGTAWADGTTNPATTVESQLDKILDELGANWSDGPQRIHTVPSGVYTTSNTLRAQLNQLDGVLNTVVNNGALENWADGTTNPATTLVAQVAKLVHDLANSAVDGAARIHGTASGSMGVGTLRAQLNQLDAAKAPLANAVRAVAYVNAGGVISWGIGVTSVVPGGTGDYMVNLSYTFSSTATMAPLACCAQGNTFASALPNTTSSVRVLTNNTSGAINSPFVVAVFGV